MAVMLRPGVGFASDLVKYREGYDGEEPDEVGRLIPVGPGQKRAAVTLNTYYPEIEGAYFENHELFGLLDDVLERAGLVRVHLDHVREDGVVPQELRGWIEPEERYALLTTDGRRVGEALRWQALWAFGSFYGKQDIVVEIVLDGDHLNAFRVALEDTCEKRSVPLQVWPPAPHETLPAKASIWRWLRARL